MEFLDGVDRNLVCLMRTGTYIGDGELINPITGIGFPPKVVYVSRDSWTEDFFVEGWFRTDQHDGDFCTLFRTGTLIGNSLISLDADGFSVDDNGVDRDPNVDGIQYLYVAWG